MPAEMPSGASVPRFENSFVRDLPGDSVLSNVPRRVRFSRKASRDSA